jgi:hypothetical protein
VHDMTATGLATHHNVIDDFIVVASQCILYAVQALRDNVDAVDVR